MTTEPTDAELKAMWQLHAADIGGIFCYARAVLAKWGQPAQAAEPCPDCTRLNAQPAPATKQAVERVYAFRRKGLADFCTCDEARYEELSNKPRLFETRIFYAAPQPSPAAQGDALDAARYRWLAASCRITSEHWGGRWSIIIDGPAPKSHDSEDDFDAAIAAARARLEGKP